MDLLSQTLFSVCGYPLSLLEFIGVLTGLAGVYLASDEKSVNFLFGLLNNVCYFILFFKFRLYSVMLLQIVYFILSLYGYYHWKHPGNEESGHNMERRIVRLTWKNRLVYLEVILLSGLCWGWGIITLQGRFPQYFDPPAYPWLDAVLTMGSVAGQWLLSRKYLDNWPLWIIIDSVSCILYAYMGMIFTAVMYGVFTLIAVKAMIDWSKTYKSYQVSPVSSGDD